MPDYECPENEPHGELMSEVDKAFAQLDDGTPDVGDQEAVAVLFAEIASLRALLARYTAIGTPEYVEALAAEHEDGDTGFECPVCGMWNYVDELHTPDWDTECDNEDCCAPLRIVTKFHAHHDHAEEVRHG